MKTFILMLLFWACLTYDVWAQNNLEGQDAQMNLNEIGQIAPVATAARGFDNRYQGIKGTPFLHENWQKGTIELTTNQPAIKDIAIRFDAHFHQFQIKMSSGIKLFLKPAFIDQVTIENEGTYLPVKAHKLGKDGEVRYTYSLFQNADIQLLKMPYKRFIKADYQQAYSVDRRYDEFADVSYEYFLRFKNDYQKFKPKKKSFLKVLPAEMRTKIERYAKSKKLSMDSESEILEVLQNGL